VILVDTSVWIDYFRGIDNAPAAKLDQALLNHQEIGSPVPSFRKSYKVAIPTPVSRGLSASSDSVRSSSRFIPSRAMPREGAVKLQARRR
jgi:hypothetical protein